MGWRTDWVPFITVLQSPSALEERWPWEDRPLPLLTSPTWDRKAPVTGSSSYTTRPLRELSLQAKSRGTLSYDCGGECGMRNRTIWSWPLGACGKALFRMLTRNSPFTKITATNLTSSQKLSYRVVSGRVERRSSGMSCLLLGVEAIHQDQCVHLAVSQQQKQKGSTNGRSKQVQ